MKRVLILFIIIKCCNVSFAQFNVYHKFPTDTCQWLIGTQQFGNPDIYTHANYFLGDTITTSTETTMGCIHQWGAIIYIGGYSS